MKTIFTALFAATLACAIAQPVSSAQPATFREKVLYSFSSNQNCTDGAAPYAGLTDIKGTLYGATAGGGVYSGGHGTVFAYDRRTRRETVIYSFRSRQQGYYCLDGSGPQAGLLKVKVRCTARPRMAGIQVATRMGAGRCSPSTRALAPRRCFMISAAPGMAKTHTPA